MVHSKKTKHTLNQTGMNLLKALKKNKSVETQQPCLENSSGECVKRKGNCMNPQKKMSKKRKRVDQLFPNQEGLKLLKRGAVTMHRIARRKILGVKKLVSFNAKGEPYGPTASEMQSYIGVLARTKPPICYHSWKHIPEKIKNKIWDCVQVAFDVPPSAETMVLNSAGQKWREFKSRLTTRYVLPYSHQHKLLESPPADYSFIKKAHWDTFVADHISDEFLKLHDQQKMRGKMNLYPHRMSRRSYANLEQELSQGDPGMKINRSTTWILARKGKDGNFQSEEIKNISMNIEKMKQRVIDGELIEEGVDDVLTKVLGNPEHGGRVRGQGTHVKQSAYFNDLPRDRKRRSVDDKIQEDIQKFVAEATSRIVRERDAFWATEMEKLKATLCEKNIRFDASPNIGTQEICPKAEPAIMKELEFQGGVKKKLDLIEDKVLVEKEKHVKNIMKKTGIEEKNEVEGKNQDVVGSFSLKPCHLSQVKVFSRKAKSSNPPVLEVSKKAARNDDGKAAGSIHPTVNRKNEEGKMNKRKGTPKRAPLF